MTKLNDLTTSQIRSVLAIKEQIEMLQSQIDSIAVGGDEIPAAPAAAQPQKKKHRMSAAGRAAIAAAVRARWAKIKGNGAASSEEKPGKKRRKMSAAVKAKIAAAARARWAKARAAL